MKKIWITLYHFYQYHIKPTKRHRTVIKTARNELKKIRLLEQKFQANYLMGALRNLNPFVFEKMLLLCFKERQFRVTRNLRHTGDGGLDGTVFNLQGQKLLIQAKCYRSAIDPQHIKDFESAIQRNSAAGGFFIHTGRTGEKSKENRPENMRILSGHSLIQFVLCK